MKTAYALADLKKARANLAGLVEWYDRHGVSSRTKDRNDIKSARLWVEVVEAAVRVNGMAPPAEDT